MDKKIIETIEIMSQLEINESIMRLMSIGYSKEQLTKFLSLMLQGLPENPPYRMAEGRIVKPNMGVN